MATSFFDAEPRFTLFLNKKTSEMDGVRNNSKPENFYPELNTRHLSFKSAFTYSNYAGLSSYEHDLSHSEETYAAKMMRLIITYLGYLIMISLFPISFWICVKRIHALERLVILRLGKLQPLLGPGYCVTLPLIDKWEVVDLHPKTYIVPANQLLTADRAIIEISATIKYCISQAVRYVTRLHSQDEPFQNLIQHCILNVVSEQDQSDLERNLERISLYIKNELNKTVIDWGLEVLTVEIPSVKVIQEGEPLCGSATILNALKAISGDWNHEVKDPPSVGVHQLMMPDKVCEEHCSVRSMKDGNIQKGSNLLERIPAWLEQEKQKNGLCLISQSFDLQVVKKNGQMDIIHVLIENGKISALENCVTPVSLPYTVTVDDDDIEDILNGKISLMQAYAQGKVQLKS